MLGIHELWLFVLSGLLLNVTPGPDTAYIIGRTIQLGWRGGAAAAIGISCGCLVHVLGAAIGLSALLMASSTAFLAVKLIGAAYLVLTGLQMLLSRTKPIAEVAGQAGETSISRVFWQGALTNILNPKVALFFLAFLPQFVAADSAHKTLAFLVLGLIFITGGTLWCLGLAAFAAKAAGGIRQSAGAIGWINRSLGALFIYLGVRVAMLEAR
ncbi:LysE family translocator [Bradyrhizobium viridifuturi]|jgi:threonine/homoserine/homoserine lactone efflux protein|uniref:LysE family translocator n=1 Tax=Bradyrhizobium TaxID=374 RepID=UPI00039852FC|nr:MULTISPECIES: LysE family translocator [Bradyrhizobium]ERF82475.1 MAG: lipopolysaccharide export system protein LptA [Bradyrhizobium sp. DFCI-1]OYU62820.1 MAG: LPS ABC transporter substrate-binding protein LptA [Bradyrhizobium sp. PARBB1]PSO22178.1 LysE family translocator [Bradyrhizobium sp. MOS004]QRI70684.1 LysE family translocator [Bradyrhizobium sp. PSBB068]MBR1023767.1 LysE family translocator [Bradyrhizobium viridifuturi]